MSLIDKIRGFREGLNNSVYRKTVNFSPGLAEMLVSDVKMPKVRPKILLYSGTMLLAGSFYLFGCGGGGGGGGNSGGGGNPTVYECNNRVDDDGDTFVDYPADPGCSSATDDSEFNPPPNDPPVVTQTFSPVSTPEDNATAAANVSSHFSDPNGDALTYSLSGFSQINAVFSGNSINISAPLNYNGTETGSVRACDPSNACVNTPLQVTFTPVNDAPVVSGITMYSAIEGANLNGIVNVSDVDGNPVTCSLVNNGGLAQLQINNDCTITSAAALPYNTAGSYTANVQASDGVGGIANSNVQINITNVNRKPVISSVTITTAQEEMALVGYVNRTDADGDPTTCELVTSDIPETRVAPDGTVYSCVNAPCNPLAPDPLPKGAGGNNRTLEVRCTDNFEVSANFIRTFRVDGFPVVSAISDQSTPEDTNKVLNVASYFSDPNNDPLIYSVQGLSMINANVIGSVITFSAPLNYNGSKTAQIRACDPLGLCISDNILVTFTPVNDAPAVIGATMYSSIEGQALDGVVNTSDVDGDPVTCSRVNDGGLTEVVINPNCTITSSVLPYTRAGTYNVTVRANDGSLNTDGIVQINVADNIPANNPPVVTAVFNPVSTPEESNASVSVLGHFSDPDFDALTYFVSGFTTINAVLNGTNIDISAPVNYNGVETGLVTACDPAPACVSTPLQIAFTAVNDNPTLNSIVITLAREGALLDGQMNATDPDLVYGDILTYSFVDNSELPELQVNPATGQIFSAVPLPYTPAFQNPFVLLKVADMAGMESANWYQINIENVNRAPTITDVVISQAEEGKVLDGGILGNDPDGDTVNCYLVSSTLLEAKVNPLCTIYSDAALPPAAQVNYNVVVRMTDGSLEDTFSRDFEVQRPPYAPGLNPLTNYYIRNEGDLLQFSVVNNGDPNPADTTILDSPNIPPNATLDPNTGQFSWPISYSDGGGWGPGTFVIYTIDFTEIDNHLARGPPTTVTVKIYDSIPPP